MAKMRPRKIVSRYSPYRSAYGGSFPKGWQTSPSWRLVPTRKRRRPLGTRNVRTGGLLGIEYKFLDNSYAAAATVLAVTGSEADPAANTISGIAVGTAQNQRDGRKCVLKSVFIRGKIYLDPLADQADVGAPEAVRVAIVLDQQTNGAQFNAEDVYVDTGTTVLAVRNLEYTGRFKVLYDRLFRLNYEIAATDGANTCSCNGNQVFFKFFKKLNIPVTFVSDNNGVADISDNSLHVMCWGSANCNLAYTSRVRFVG